MKLGLKYRLREV